jgi:hypothetical protein
LMYRLGGTQVLFHFIHTHSTHILDGDTAIKLTASQRDFAISSEFDNSLCSRGLKHLHFLFDDKSEVRIYRQLYCVHEPNLFRWNIERRGSLSTAKICRRTGEIVFPEDVESRDEVRRHDVQYKVAIRSLHSNTPSIKIEPIVPPKPPEVTSFPLVAAEPQPAEPALNLIGPFRCEDCGIETTKWVQSTPSAGTCVCRKCTADRFKNAQARAREQT